MNLELVPLDDLHQDPGNVRTHGERNMEAIRESLSQFGQVEPLVVQEKTGRVIGGNGRLEAMT
jgi:ParB-like chromosome segregation protein Spo0J